ncbi:Sodium-dependent glucose transporter 1 [Orchesella cincta]|uniref:Sodium-dependent glucose transporter 1 n=1 Tax=Orchesella cincta TaxID=48709 RepID=A0A1D2N6J1_ORCCI|nr:Sodium-dependent glucose transporter 1 [Orchesella cincta]
MHANAFYLSIPVQQVALSQLVQVGNEVHSHYMTLSEKMGQEKDTVSCSSSDDKRKPLSKTQKHITALGIFYGNIAYGCAFNTYGPAITSLQNKYETDDATISRVFTILTIFYMCGALLAGVIFKYVNRQFAILFVLATMATMIFLTPHCPTMTLFFVTAAVLGIAAGTYDCSQIVWMMEMMQKDCPVYLQCQHFCYALGANLGSVIMAPFLDEGKGEIVTSISETEKLLVPYTIVGCILVGAVTFNAFVFFFLRYYPPPPEITESHISPNFILENGNPTSSSEVPPMGKWSWPKLRIVILSCCFCGAYQAMELCVLQFFPKFGQNSDLHLSESDSTYVLTGLTASFAIGRAISIIAVFKISVQRIICGNLGLLIIANTLLFGWAKSSLTMLWASSILYGLGFSSVYASFTAYIERHLNITNFIGSMLLVCGSGVAAIYPLVVGTFIEQNPIVLSFISYFSITVLILAFGTLSYLTHKNKTRYV